MQKKNKQKNIYYAKMLSTNWLMIVIAILVFIMIFAFVYLNDQISDEKSVNNNLQVQIDNIKKNTTPSSKESLLIDYYRELSNKTDEAINRILVIVGIIATIITLFGLFFAFKAPHDIDKRIDEIKKELESAKEAAEEARYQAKIAFALTEYSRTNKIIELGLLIKEYPNKPEAYVLRGKYLLYKKKYDKVITDYETADRLGFSKVIFYNNMGNVYYLKNEYNKAISFFDKALKEKPEYAEALYNRALAYVGIENYEKAILDLDEAIFLSPDRPDFYNERGRIYIGLSKNSEDPNKVNEYESLYKKDMERSFEIDPEA